MAKKKKTRPTVSARQIVKLLREKHWQDVFVSECKTGSTWMNQALRLDVWAMKRSWAKPYIQGYEVKISRSDFNQDDKWEHYRDFCTHFSFVCPAGLIAPEELPDKVGLLYVSSTGTKLYTKRKAVGDLERAIPVDIFKYILMSRATIQNDYKEKWGIGVGPLEKSDQREYWEAWLKAKKDDHEFGIGVARALGRAKRDKIHRVERENDRLRTRSEKLKQISEWVDAAGLKLEGWNWEEFAREKIDKFIDGFDPKDIELIKRSARVLAELAERMDVR